MGVKTWTFRLRLALALLMAMSRIPGIRGTGTKCSEEVQGTTDESVPASLCYTEPLTTTVNSATFHCFLKPNLTENVVDHINDVVSEPHIRNDDNHVVDVMVKLHAENNNSYLSCYAIADLAQSDYVKLIAYVRASIVPPVLLPTTGTLQPSPTVYSALTSSSVGPTVLTTAVSSVLLLTSTGTLTGSLQPSPVASERVANMTVTTDQRLISSVVADTARSPKPEVGTTSPASSGKSASHWDATSGSTAQRHPSERMSSDLSTIAIVLLSLGSTVGFVSLTVSLILLCSIVKRHRRCRRPPQVQDGNQTEYATRGDQGDHATRREFRELADGIKQNWKYYWQRDRDHGHVSGHAEFGHETAGTVS